MELNNVDIECLLATLDCRANNAMKKYSTEGDITYRIEADTYSDIQDIIINLSQDTECVSDEDIDDEDIINEPNHYKLDYVDYECIDVIRMFLSEEEFRGFLKGYAFRYLWRHPYKYEDKSIDLKKFNRVLNMLEDNSLLLEIENSARDIVGDE